MANVDILHVPYKGGGESTTAMTGGQVSMSFGAIHPALSLLKAGKLRPSRS